MGLAELRFEAFALRCRVDSYCFIVVIYFETEVSGCWCSSWIVGSQTSGRDEVKREMKVASEMA